jgi:hypothetical protein
MTSTKDRIAEMQRDRILEISYIKQFNDYCTKLILLGVPIDKEISRDKIAKWFDKYLDDISKGVK